MLRVLCSFSVLLVVHHVAVRSRDIRGVKTSIFSVGLGIILRSYKQLNRQLFVNHRTECGRYSLRVINQDFAWYSEARHQAIVEDSGDFAFCGFVTGMTLRCSDKWPFSTTKTLIAIFGLRKVLQNVNSDKLQRPIWGEHTQLAISPCCMTASRARKATK